VSLACLLQSSVLGMWVGAWRTLVQLPRRVAWIGASLLLALVQLSGVDRISVSLVRQLWCVAWIGGAGAWHAGWVEAFQDFRRMVCAAWDCTRRASSTFEPGRPYGGLAVVCEAVVRKGFANE
jgi:hypothetical protein